jgi:hypothetical protein
MRLAQAEPGRRAGHAALVEQRVECHQQVEVYPGEVHIPCLPAVIQASNVLHS